MSKLFPMKKQCDRKFPHPKHRWYIVRLGEREWFGCEGIPGMTAEYLIEQIRSHVDDHLDCDSGCSGVEIISDLIEEYDRSNGNG